FNRAQQDAFLPAVEDGTLSLLGATTENPSFELNGALLSRCRVFVLKHLTTQEIATLLDRAMADAERGLGGRGVILPPESRDALASLAGGDARAALNALELAAYAAPENCSAGFQPAPADAAQPEGAGRMPAPQRLISIDLVRE